MGSPHFDHEITNLRTAPGELSFDTRIGERTTSVWMRTDSPVMPNADAALAAAAMPAMRQGGRLRMTDPVSPRMLRGQREFQAIQRSWSLDWPFTEPLEEVEVSAPVRELGTVAPKGRVAAFFSGGVDSWGTVLDNPDLTDLIFVRGFDLAHEGPHTALADEVEGRLREAADALGMPLHVVTTNLRELSDAHLPWDVYYGCALDAVALFLGPLFDRVLIAGDADYEVQGRWGNNWLVDRLWSTEALEIVADGGRHSRLDRLRRVVEDPIACSSLRVCWENPDRTYNCGRCQKCLMTLIPLEAIGARERVTSFPPGFDLDPKSLAMLAIHNLVSLSYWEDILDAAREAERADLEAAVVPVVAKAKAGLGLPRDFRRRHLPGPPPSGAAQSQTLFPADSTPALFATAETAAAIAQANSLAFLVGGYDGSGNFGDVLMLDAALELLAPLEPGLVVLPVLERKFGAHHPELAEQMIRPPRHQVYFDPAGEAREDGLVPIAAGPGLSSAVTYFYGGGYFNGFWGDRKLAMMRAAEALLAAAAPDEIRRVGSGLQVEAEWLAGLSPEDTALLRAFELLGTREPRSGEALAGFVSAIVPESGDDAVGALGRLRPSEPPGEGPLQVNLHFTEHDWVTGEAEPLLNFYVDLISELAQQGRPIRVQPLIAYLDPRVNERPAAQRLAAALASRGIEVREPLVLRPAGLGAAAAEMGTASLTVACSYHVALASLMLCLPTLMVSHNAFYEQKTAGLLDAFGQPPDFAIRPDVDPRACARLLEATVLDPAAGGQLRVQLALDARRMRRLRAYARADLFARIAGTVAGIEEGSPQWVGPDAALDRRVRAAEGRARAAQERAAHSELHASNLEAQMSEMTGSTSWRLTRPLRRFVRKVR